MKRMRGFSLLEALIALLVLAVGLLGIASMQAASVYATHVGALKGLAAVEAQSIAAAMTANPDAFPPGGTYPYNTSDAYGVSYTLNCSTASCATDEMADYDLAQWGQELRNDLPDGNGAISCLGPPTYAQPQCTIKVTWLQKTMAPGAGTAPGKFSTANYQVLVQP